MAKQYPLLGIAPVAAPTAKVAPATKGGARGRRKSLLRLMAMTNGTNFEAAPPGMAWYIIDPRVRVRARGLAHPRAADAALQGNRMRVWDLIIVFMLLFTAVFTTFEVSFFPDGMLWVFVLNRIVDVVFVVVRAGSLAARRCC